MLSAVRRIGHSAGIVIPKTMLVEFGVAAGDSVDMRLESGRIVIERVQQRPRDGWADDSKLIAEAGDELLVWPEFASFGDDAMTW